MFALTAEKSYGTATARVRVTAASIERALRLVGEDARVVFPIDSGPFFAARIPRRASRGFHGLGTRG
jgi:hypothetical protein